VGSRFVVVVSMWADGGVGMEAPGRGSSYRPHAYDNVLQEYDDETGWNNEHVRVEMDEGVRLGDVLEELRGMLHIIDCGFCAGCGRECRHDRLVSLSLEVCWWR
jgi:hypothetical protein